MAAGFNWYKDRVMLVANQAVNIKGLALQVEAHAKQNIVDNDQVDTGFMLNTVYSVFPGGDTFGQTSPAGEYQNKAGQMVRRQSLPPSPLPRQVQAAVAVGAEYAIFQELANSFLYKALEQTAGETGSIIKKF